MSFAEVALSRKKSNYKIQYNNKCFTRHVQSKKGHCMRTNVTSTLMKCQVKETELFFVILLLYLIHKLFAFIQFAIIFEPFFLQKVPFFLPVSGFISLSKLYKDSENYQFISICFTNIILTSSYHLYVLLNTSSI